MHIYGQQLFASNYTE